MSKINEVADAIESGQYKYALQVCNKSLKKAKASAESHTITAYKALALLYLDNGKDDEATALVDQVRKTHPVDRKLIAILAQALDLLGKGTEVNQLYEEASKKLVKDEDFNRNWFHQMILRSDIDGARKAAMVLYKLPNQRKYFYWLLTAWKNHNRSSQLRSLSISMSTKLVDHALSNPNLLPETTGEVLLLLSAAPTVPALTFLQGDGKKWTTGDIEVRRTYIDLLHGTCKYSDLRSFCEDEIEQGADDWKVVKGWIDGHLGMFQQTTSEMNLLQTLLSKLNKRFSCRNFALGSIYLSASYSGDSKISIPSAREQCTRYFTEYGRKAACFADIHSYVAGLSKAAQCQFLHDIAATMKVDEKPYDRITRELNLLKFDYMLRPWTTENPEDLIRCWKLYIEGTKYSDPADDIDSLPGDDALLLGCYTLVKEYVSTKHAKYLLQAAVWLETGLTKSKHNFQFKLLITRVYLLLGAVPSAMTWYTSLQVKQIQFDTLSHILLSRISTIYPDNSLMHQIAGSYIYSSSEEEIPPQIFNSFLQGSYHNAPDFWDLWMKLRHSLTKAMSSREWEVIAGLGSDGVPVEEISGELFDQRDLTVMMNCELPGNSSPEEFTRSGPLQKATAAKVLAYGQRMEFCLTNLKSGTIDVKNLKAMRASKEHWEIFRKETTPQEFANMELLCEIFACREGIIEKANCNLDFLTESLKARIPFSGLDSNDITWEILHAAWLTVESCRCILGLVSGHISRENTMLVSGAKAIIDITTKAQKAVIEKLEVKLNICGARSIGETLKRLTDNIIGEVDYMSPFKDFVEEEFSRTKLREIVVVQGNVLQKALEAARTQFDKTLTFKEEF